MIQLIIRLCLITLVSAGCRSVTTYDGERVESEIAIICSESGSADSDLWSDWLIGIDGVSVYSFFVDADHLRVLPGHHVLTFDCQYIDGLNYPFQVLRLRTFLTLEVYAGEKYEI